VSNIIDQLDRHANLGHALAVTIVIVGLFLLAWLVSRLASWVAAYVIARAERRRAGRPGEDTAFLTGVRQRETAISLIQTTVRYLAFLVAVVFSLVALSGAHRLQTIAGASFLAIIVGFAAQRFLTDVIAGLLMFFEGWFRIGDTVAIDVLQVQGVVEAVSLRSLTIRSVTGEILHVANSQVVALRVIPRGYREVEIEFFTSALEPGRQLVEQIARIVPVGPTRFVRRPELTDTDALDDDLYQITARCAVAVGREWLAQDFLPSLIRERAAKGLLVHGPIITYVDERAARSFARALLTTRPQPNEPHRSGG
jgi:small-conductance mechanosensitive channel